MRLRPLSRRYKPRGTRFLLRRAGLNHRAAVVLSRLSWRWVRPYKVAPGTVLHFYGTPAPRRIVVEVDNSRPLLYNGHAELPDYWLKEHACSSDSE